MKTRQDCSQGKIKRDIQKIFSPVYIFGGRLVFPQHCGRPPPPKRVRGYAHGVDTSSAHQSLFAYLMHTALYFALIANLIYMKHPHLCRCKGREPIKGNNLQTTDFQDLRKEIFISVKLSQRCVSRVHKKYQFIIIK